MKKITSTAGEKLVWRCNTPALLKEIFNNPGTGILRKPFQLFASILAEVGERASEIDDPELNKLMLRLAIYEVGDGYSKGKDPVKYDEAMALPNDEHKGTRSAAPKMLEALTLLKEALCTDDTGHSKLSLTDNARHPEAPFNTMFYYKKITNAIEEATE